MYRRDRSYETYTDPPMTLDRAVAAKVRLIVVPSLRPQVEPDPGELANRYGADTSVLDWHKRLVCSRCGSRQVDFVLTVSRGVGRHNLTAGVG